MRSKGSTVTLAPLARLSAVSRVSQRGGDLLFETLLQARDVALREGEGFAAFVALFGAAAGALVGAGVWAPTTIAALRASTGST